MSIPVYNSSILTSVARVPQNLPFPQYVFGGAGGAAGTTYTLFKKTTALVFSLWRSPTFEIGKDFDVLGITFNVYPTLASGMTIIPVLYFDDSASNSIGTTINSTNYSDTFISLEAKNFGNAVHGKDNFFLELQFTGATLAVVSLPIHIALDIFDT